MGKATTQTLRLGGVLLAGNNWIRLLLWIPTNNHGAGVGSVVPWILQSVFLVGLDKVLYSAAHRATN